MMQERGGGGHSWEVVLEQVREEDVGVCERSQRRARGSGSAGYVDTKSGGLVNSVEGWDGLS